MYMLIYRFNKLIIKTLIINIVYILIFWLTFIYKIKYILTCKIKLNIYLYLKYIFIYN